MMGLLAWVIRVVYRICALLPQRNKVCFLSRQSSRPFDFQLLESAISRAFPGWEIAWACVPPSGHFGIGLALRQVWHAATARVCFVDGYVPAVSVPRRTRAYCVQLWHALGSIKKFGYQALDTPDGRSSEAAEKLRMHRGYDLIVAGLPGAVPAFSEAFDCPSDRIVPLGLPRIDYLLSEDYDAVRKARVAKVAYLIDAAGSRSRNEKLVLYAPTLRRGSRRGDGWFIRSIEEIRGAFCAREDIALVVAGHPLQDEAGADQLNDVRFLHGAATFDVLPLVDYVVTDYSAVAFEAGLLGKKVLFYVPDIDEYRISPGLNIDPLEVFSGLSFREADSLAHAITSDMEGASSIESFDVVASRYIGVVEGRSIERIVSTMIRAMGEGRVS